MDVSAVWSAAIEDWSLARQRAGSARTSIRTRREHLAHLARCLGEPDPWAVSGEQLLAWCDRQRWMNETRRGRYNTFHGFYRWGVAEGHVEISPALVLPRVQPTPPRPRPADDQSYRIALAAACPRERLMLRLSAEVGLRRAEVAQVHTDDLLPDLIGTSLRVHGKGGRERVIPLPEALAAALRGLPYGYAFPGEYGGHLSPQWVGILVARLLPPGLTMHTLRHRFATRTYDSSGKDIRVVQELMGHASVNTTQAYIAVPDHRLRSAVEGAAA